MAGSRLAVAFPLSCFLAGACGDDEVARPPIIWEGEHLRYGTDSDLELCAGTLPYLDGVTGHLAKALEQPDATVDYYWLPDGVDPYCANDNVLGCTPAERETFSTLAVHQHELVHALRWPGTLYLPLEEGLAEAYGDDWEPVYPVSGDIAYLLREFGGASWRRGTPTRSPDTSSRTFARSTG